jgi:hypothetical protein
MLGFGRRVLASFAVITSLASSARAQPRPAPKDDSWFRVQLQETRTHVDGLQGELRRIQAGLKLAEAQFQPPPKADLHVIDGMSSAFLLTSVRVWVDDVLTLSREDERGALGAARDVHWVTGPLSPGEHVTRVAIQLRGNGAVLPYMRAYRFELSSSHKFTTAIGRTTTISIRTLERGDATTPYVHLPALEWDEQLDAGPAVP